MSVVRRATGGAAEKTRVYITIDTETSLGGAWRHAHYEPVSLDRSVYGKIGDRLYGIPLIMDILEEYGFRGTFFTEVLCSYFVGREEVAGVLRSISDRGHDGQLHVHPVYRFYKDFKEGKGRREVDLHFRLSLDEQREIIASGVELFRQMSGRSPRAFRAGCYGAAESTLIALREKGISIDSSYNLAYLGSTCGFETPGLNAPAVLQGVCEFPVSVFRVRGAGGFKPLEISAVSVSEILATIAGLRQAGCLDVVLVLHSFSLLKNIGLRFEECTPDRMVIRRLRKLCAALRERHDEIEVRVLGEVDPKTLRIPQPNVIPTVGWFRPAVRKAAQAVNRLPWL